MIPEQLALLEKAERSLRAAQLLLEDDLPEFAVSRAYYAMFYISEAFLLQDGLSFSSHKAVIAGFDKHFAKTGRVPIVFHRYLVDAQEDRATGDYGLSPDVTAKEATLHIERAQALLELAKAQLETVQLELLGLGLEDLPNRKQTLCQTGFD